MTITPKLGASLLSPGARGVNAVTRSGRSRKARVSRIMSRGVGVAPGLAPAAAAPPRPMKTSLRARVVTPSRVTLSSSR